MKTKFMLSASLLLLATPGFAQAGPTSVKSAEDIVGELTGDTEDLGALGTREAQGSRGFSVRNPGAGKKPQAVVPRVGAVATPYAPPTSLGRGHAVSGSRPDRARVRSSNLAVGFVTGSAQLDGAGQVQAAALLAALRSPKLADRRILVAGHTDSVGGREYNLDLSRRRADALVDYLGQNGVDRSRLEARGYGFDRPLPNTSPRAGANRRVEISVAE